MSQFKKESSKKTVQKKDHTQTNTLRSYERSDIQGTHSTISTNFGLQHIALQLAQQFPFGFTRNVTKEKKVEVIEIEDDIDSEEVSDLPSIDFLLRCLNLHVAKDPTVREIIAGHFFVVPQGLEAFVEIYNDDELSDSEIASSMELIFCTKPFERTLATPPDVLYCQTNDKYYTQDEIAEYLKNSDHNYDWIINELINELHALYIRVRNLDNNKAMLQDFVKIMLPSIAEYIHIIDKLVVHVRKLFIDWRNKLWVALLNKYKELGNSYNKLLRKLSAIQIANMMSVEDIRKIWKQWCCNINEAALEAAMESLRDVCAMGFRAIDVEESLNKVHDRFLCLYNDLFTVNLSITTRYNIATSMDLSVYYFEEFKRRPLGSKNTITISEVSTPIRKTSSSVNEKKNNKKKVTSRNTYEVFRKTHEIPAFTLQVPRSMLEESAVNDKGDDDDNEDRDDEDVDEEVDDFESEDRDVDDFLQGNQINELNTREQVNESNTITNINSMNNLPEVANKTNVTTQLDGLNALDICNWLVRHPYILDLANKMLSAKTSHDETNVNNSSSSFSSSNENKSRLWDEELKCLFLRQRSSAILDSFIRLVCEYKPYTEEAKSIMRVSRKRLGDYRNKLNTSIAKLVQEFKELKQREQQRVPALPSQSSIDQYIDEAVVAKKILQRYIASTNEAELKRNGSFIKLVEFICECFKIHYRNKDVKKVKELDALTKDLFIPSRSGRNLASSLVLE
ncbi:unnamed protein product [Rhizophagus irregularis]|nr:unnamed protein product [Rhizophagus irregularis]